MDHPHPNVLEFQAGGCIFYSLDEVNQCITSSDDKKHMLVKLGILFSRFYIKAQIYLKINQYLKYLHLKFQDGPDTECPFVGPLDFSYTLRGGLGGCRSPQSEVSQCLQDSQLMFSFQSCTEDYFSISKGKEFYQPFI